MVGEVAAVACGYYYKSQVSKTTLSLVLNFNYKSELVASIINDYIVIVNFFKLDFGHGDFIAETNWFSDFPFSI